MFDTVLDILTVPRYINAICKRASLRVEWERPGSVPRTDGKTIWLPYPTVADDPVFLRQLVCSALHEALHIMHTDFSTTKHLAGFRGMVLNGLEDHRIEAIDGREYRGDWEYLNWQCERSGEEIVKTVQATDLALYPPKERDIAGAMTSLMFWDALQRIRQYPGASAFLPLKSNPEAQKFLVRYAAHPELAHKLEAVVSSEDPVTNNSMALLPVVNEIMDKVYFDLTDEQKDGKKKGKGEGGEGKCKGEGKGEGEDGKGEDEGKGEGEGKGETDKDSIVVKWSALMPKDHQAKGNTKTSIIMDYSTYDRAGKGYHPGKVRVVNLARGKNV